MYAAIAWTILIAPNQTVDLLPTEWRLLWFHSDVDVPSMSHHLPPLPDSRSQAFKLGLLWAQHMANATIESSANLLAQAASVLTPKDAKIGLSQISNVSLTESDLQLMLQRLINEESRVSLTYRVASMFSFINFIWLLSIIGITVSIGPSLWVILRPIRHLLETLAKRLLEHVLIPLAVRCHEWGLFELLLWGVSVMILIDSYRFYGIDAGLYVSLTSVGVGCLGLAYSALRHSKGQAKGDRNILYNLYAVLTLLPLALIFHSQLIAFAVVTSLYYLLGFSVVCGGLCWFIGFEKEETMARAASCSALILTLLVVVRLNVDSDSIYNEALEPFRAPLSIYGSIVLDIALLIISHPSTSVDLRRHKVDLRRILWLNALMIAALMFQLFFGTAVGLPGMHNTACVFGILWVTMHYSRFHFEVLHLNAWVFILIASMATWRSALWLHANPDFVVKCFTHGA